MTSVWESTLEQIRHEIGKSMDSQDSKPGGIRWDTDFVSCKARTAGNILNALQAMEYIIDKAADFVQVVNEDHDLSKPIMMPGEFDTLEEALQEWRGERS